MILDASAFYAGVPFGSPDKYKTTPHVYDEISHIKRAQDVAGALIDMGRLSVVHPNDTHMVAARAAATASGDLPDLSGPDISILALASQTGLDIITDDYALSNTAHMMGIHTHPVMTRGPAVYGRWIYRCASCQRIRPPGRRCHVCGSSLSRRLQNTSKSPSYSSAEAPAS